MRTVSPPASMRYQSAPSPRGATVMSNWAARAPIRRCTTACAGDAASTETGVASNAPSTTANRRAGDDEENSEKVMAGSDNAR